MGPRAGQGVQGLLKWVFVGFVSSQLNDRDDRNTIAPRPASALKAPAGFAGSAP